MKATGTKSLPALARLAMAASATGADKGKFDPRALLKAFRALHGLAA